jgi:integrase
MRDFTVKQVQAAVPGRHRVSQSLYLFVGPNGGRRFIFRFTSPRTGRVTEMGLGSADVMTLAEARAKVHEARRMVAKGEDPIEAKREQRAASVTFASVVTDYMAVQERRYRNPNSAHNEHRLLLTHAGALGSMPIANIGTSHIDQALRPLWLRVPGQARRTLAAITRVLRFAKAQGHEVANVAEICEDGRHLLPRVNGARKHFRAMPYAKVPEFVGQLRVAQQQGEALSPSVIEFIVLTAARESEAVGMRWGEVNWEEKVWVVPAERMKAGREHRVPLSAQALAKLMRQRILLARQHGLDGKGFEPDPNGYV